MAKQVLKMGLNSVVSCWIYSDLAFGNLGSMTAIASCTGMLKFAPWLIALCACILLMTSGRILSSMARLVADWIWTY